MSNVKNRPQSQIVPKTPGLSACPRTWSQALLSCTTSFTTKHLCYRLQAQSSPPPKAEGLWLNQGGQGTMCGTALCWCDRHTKGTKLSHRKPEEASDGLPSPPGI